MSKNEYGIITQNTVLTDLTKAKQDNLQNKRTALLGAIVYIESVLGNGFLAVKFLKDGDQWESTSFHCQRDHVAFIDEKLWNFLAAIVSPMERVKLAKNKRRCEKIMQISKDMVVSFADYKDVYLGTVKHIGYVKGMGHCFGLQLHQKKEKNKCDGSCAGIQYFNCRPGFGIFTTIDKILPQNYICNSDDATETSELEAYVQKNVSCISINNTDLKEEKLDFRLAGDNYKENIKDPTPVNLKCSLSLQNISENVNKETINTNNDFDQNTILQPESTYLVRERQKLKNMPTKSTAQFYTSEVEFMDSTENIWSKSSFDRLETNSNFKSSLDKLDFSNDKNNLKTSPRSKNTNPISQLMNGKILSKKTKLNQDRISQINRNETNIKINERNISMPQHNSSQATTSKNSEKLQYFDPDPGTTNDLSIGTLVEVVNDIVDEPLYGVIRWMGQEVGSNSILVGIELEDELIHLPMTTTDGTHHGIRYFECSSKKGIFIPLSHCHKDSRFQDGTPTPVHTITEKMFGKVDCPVIEGFIAPLCLPTEEDVEAVCGKFRGIQGHHNSCYLDATLFSMFTYTGVFDSLLYRPTGPNDIQHYEEVQRVLREEIVNPLRTSLFVRADRVMTLRKLLDQLSSVSGLTSEEKDPEEFLNSLLAQILKAEPFLKLNSGQESYYYQLFVEKDDRLELPSVQQLFEQSFFTSDIKLKEVPSCLIIQMPRFGKSYKMYPRILPSQLLDVTDIIENSPRQCTVCGKLAKWECRQCFGEGDTMSLESTAFCTKCLEVAHSHSKRTNHNPRSLNISPDFTIMAEHCPPPRLFMELFAVVCIETSHYVAFVKCGVGHEAPWCFFDSMADRKGERNGYNIPEMVACPDVSKWLSDETMCRSLHENTPIDRLLPEHARRLLCDAYICMYQSPDVLMYR